ncbi:MAG: hypothetical protein NC253_11705 [Ruminococcus sp.]|nr:hypothetical protein [Ruminococcus sp.]MCM1381132.1 hypothetical protein [Muribaculaceae bacterium]MCM1479804.1 hypothetical protein [Muribaculaceae bacterium]
MTELEKLEAGLEYSFWDGEVSARKRRKMPVISARILMSLKNAGFAFFR